MDKEKISKEIIRGVDLCSRQLELIKGQLIDYLGEAKLGAKAVDDDAARRERKRPGKVVDVAEVMGGNKKRKEGGVEQVYAEAESSGESYPGSDLEDTHEHLTKHGRPPKMKSAALKGRRQEREESEVDSEEDSGARTNLSDPEFTVTSLHKKRKSKTPSKRGKKGRGRPRKSDYMDSDDSLKAGKGKKARGRPRKNMYYDDEEDESFSDQEKPMMDSVENEESSNDGQDDEDDEMEDQKMDTVSPHGRGRPKKQEGIEDEDRVATSGGVRPVKKIFDWISAPYQNGDDTKVTPARGRGRPPRTDKMPKVTEGVTKKGVGRPSKKMGLLNTSNDSEKDEEDPGGPLVTSLQEDGPLSTGLGDDGPHQDPSE